MLAIERATSYRAMAESGGEEAEMISGREEDLNEDTDSSECDEPPTKRTKFSGAFQYKTKFNKDWQKDWPFVSSVPGQSHSFKCSICSKYSAVIIKVQLMFEIIYLLKATRT